MRTEYLPLIMYVLLTLAITAYLTYPVISCYFPEDAVAIEVVLNKPGITYDLRLLSRLGGVKVLSSGALAYRSHLSDYVVIVVLKEPLTPNGVIKYLSIRVQPTYKVLKNGTVKSLVSKELVREVLKYELNWLIKAGVIRGLSSEDVSKIYSVARAGMAGWNSRLVYVEGEWMPYYRAIKYIPGASLIRSCIVGIPEANELIKSLPKEPPGTYLGSRFTTNDLIAVLTAVAASMVTYVVIRKFIK